MGRLKSALVREYEEDPETKIQFYNPRNTVAVELAFRGEKLAKVVGSLAVDRPDEGHVVSGVLVRRNFNYHILAPSDLHKYTDMTTSTVTQRQSIYFGGSFQVLQFMVSQVSIRPKITFNKIVIRFKRHQNFYLYIIRPNLI